MIELFVAVWVLGIAIPYSLSAYPVSALPQLVQIDQSVGQFTFASLPRAESDIRQALDTAITVNTQFGEFGNELVNFRASGLMSRGREELSRAGSQQGLWLTFERLEYCAESRSAAVVEHEWRGWRVGWWLATCGCRSQHDGQDRIDGPQFGPVLSALRRARQTGSTHAHAQKHIQSSLTSRTALLVHSGPAELKDGVAVRTVEYGDLYAPA